MKTIALALLIGISQGVAAMPWPQFQKLTQDLRAKGLVTRYPDIHYVGYSIARGDAPDVTRERHVAYLTLGGQGLDDGTFRPLNVNEVDEVWTKAGENAWLVHQTITTAELDGSIRSILKHDLLLDDRVLKDETNVSLVTNASEADIANFDESLARWVAQLSAL